MATYLKALPQTPVPVPDPAASEPPRRAGDSVGAKLYTQHCAQCHGDEGEGVPGIYPALAGSRSVTMDTPANLVHVVLEGGFPPATRGNPRPFGMPPFATVLSDGDVAHLLSHIRASWDNHAAPVVPRDVQRFRANR
jgi:mono/diheme cytochrome c family protein